MSKLKCGVCIKFQLNIERRCNYSDKWITGADSVRTSDIRDRAKTDQHKQAMMLLKKEQPISKGEGPSAYAPITRLLDELPEDAC